MTLSAENTVRGLPLPPDLRSVESAGATFAYRETGSGEPVVFVHGSISDLTIWDRNVPVIGGRYRAIAYSRRYAWPNTDLPPGDRDTMDQHVDDLLSFLRAIDAYPAHLVGNSLGAFISLIAAIREPAAVRSLVVEEPPLIPLVTGNPPHPAKIAQSLVTRPRVALPVLRFAATTVAPVGKLIKAGQIETSIDRFATGVLGADAYAAMPETIRRHMYANASTHVGQYLADGGFASVKAADIRQVSAPALIVTGADSPVLFHRLAQLLATLLSASSRLEVPQATHAMHMQNAEYFNARLLQFLEGARSSR